MQVGIVGLPNVGKSTLFNAATHSRKAESANYPFCTIEPNIGVLEVPDARLEPLSQIAKTQVMIPAAIEIVDIAGLVAGANKGEGLGNKFLANIRTVNAIVHVVRCFEDPDVVHNMGSVDPIRDIEVIATELILADLQSVENQIERNKKRIKAQDKEAMANLALLERLLPHLNANKPANTLEMTDDERERFSQFGLLSLKPVLFACNVSDSDITSPEKNVYVQKVHQYVREHHDAGICVICAQLESDLVDLDPVEAKAFLEQYGVHDSGVSELIRSSYALLGLASYFTAGEKEVRAWTFKKGMKAPQCAGVIHTDFEKGFIKAEIVSYSDLIKVGSYDAARHAGKYRIEGKDYIFQDGDVAHFRFSH